MHRKGALAGDTTARPNGKFQINMASLAKIQGQFPFARFAIDFGQLWLTIALANRRFMRWPLSGVV